MNNKTKESKKIGTIKIDIPPALYKAGEKVMGKDFMRSLYVRDKHAQSTKS